MCLLAWVSPSMSRRNRSKEDPRRDLANRFSTKPQSRVVRCVPGFPAAFSPGGQPRRACRDESPPKPIFRRNTVRAVAVSVRQVPALERPPGVAPEVKLRRHRIVWFRPPRPQEVARTHCEVAMRLWPCATNANTTPLYRTSRTRAKDGPCGLGPRPKKVRPSPGAWQACSLTCFEKCPPARDGEDGHSRGLEFLCPSF